MKIIIEAHINYRCWQLIDQDSDQYHEQLIADVFNETNARIITKFLNKLGNDYKMYSLSEIFECLDKNLLKKKKGKK